MTVHVTEITCYKVGLRIGGGGVFAPAMHA